MVSRESGKKRFFQPGPILTSDPRFRNGNQTELLPEPHSHSWAQLPCPVRTGWLPAQQRLRDTGTAPGPREAPVRHVVLAGAEV